MSHIKVLLIEDDKVDQIAFQRLIRRAGLQYDYKVAGSIGEAKGLLTTDTFDIAVLDYQLGDGTAQDVIDHLVSAKIPCVISTGSGDEEIAVMMLRAGASDYLIKDPERTYLTVLPATIDKAIKNRQLESQSELLSHVLKTIHDEVYITDEQGIFLFVNQRFCTSFGYRDDELVGQSIEILNQPALAEQVYSRLHSDSQKVSETTLILTRADQSFSASLTQSVIPTLTGQSQILVGIIHDITERLLVEAALHHSEARYRAIVEDQTELICRFLASGILTFVNNAYCRYFNKSISELIGHRFMLDMPPDDLELVTQQLASLSPVNQVITYEHRVWVSSNDMRWQQWTCRAITGADGSIVEYQAVGRDITDLKRSQEAAERANRSKSEFLATISHEIRTPMNAVIAMAELLQETSLNLHQREFVDTIRTGGETLLALIKDILDFSKIEARRLELDEDPFNLRECIENAVALLQPKARKKGLPLQCLIPSQVPRMIVGDIGRLTQILVNLLSNGIKFTQEGQVSISVQAQPLDLSSSQSRSKQSGSSQLSSQQSGPLVELAFAVADTGIGIPANNLNDLFKPFSQLDPSVTRKYGGTGLGLAISKQLVELMGGRIWVDSCQDQGSTFYFTIQAPVWANNEQELLSIQGKRILIIESNPLTLATLQSYLQPWHLHCDVARSVNEALHQLDQAAPYDIAILDMDLPDVEGTTLLNFIRYHPNGQQLPFLLLSASSSYSDSPHRSLVQPLVQPVQQDSLLQGILAFLRPSDPASLSEFEDLIDFPTEIKVLLAEDNAINQTVALALLNRIGLNADVVNHGLEVIDALKHKSYDLILMDIQMPEMDGLEATRRLRTMGYNLWIIAMTANGSSEDRERCLEAGIDDYISKPVKVKDFVQSFHTYLRFHPNRANSTRQLKLIQSTYSIHPANPSAANGRSLPAVDWSAFKELAHLGDKQFLQTVVNSYLTSLPTYLDTLTSALQSQDPVLFSRTVHNLNGVSSTIGLTALSNLCQQLQPLGQQWSEQRNCDPSIPQMVEEIKHEMQRLSGELQAYLGALQP